MGKVICVHTSTPRSGKTTIAIALACVLQSAGFRVHLIDTDNQRSFFEWSQRNSTFQSLPSHAEHSDISQIIENIYISKALSNYTIIDTNISPNQATHTSISLSDLLIVPITASIRDFQESKNIINVLRSVYYSSGHSTKILPTLNALSPTLVSDDAARIRAAFEREGLFLHKGLCDRDVFRRLPNCDHSLFSGMAADSPDLEAARAEANELAQIVVKRAGAGKL